MFPESINNLINDNKNICVQTIVSNIKLTNLENYVKITKEVNKNVKNE